MILCERGIKGSGTEMRNTFDLGAVALARQLTHLPCWPILRTRPAGAIWFRPSRVPPGRRGRWASAGSASESGSRVVRWRAVPQHRRVRKANERTWRSRCAECRCRACPRLSPGVPTLSAMGRNPGVRSCMQISKITIVGCGLIGGSLGSALRASGFRGGIAGSDAAEVLEKAVRLGAIDIAAPTIESAVQDADVIVLATPISSILALLPVVAEHAPAHALITDTGSTKVEIVAKAKSVFPEPPRIGDSCPATRFRARNAPASSKPIHTCFAGQNGCSRRSKHSRTLRPLSPPLRCTPAGWS